VPLAGSLKAPRFQRLRMSGRRAILLTGRRVDDLLSVCPRLVCSIMSWRRNGGVLYEPPTREQTLLGKPPPPEFVQRRAKRRFPANYEG